MAPALPFDSSAPLLEIRSLGRRHPNGVDWLLRDISLSLRPGERLALIGPSGAGKTLLLRQLALLDRPDAGEFLWRGARVDSRTVPGFRSRCIYLHQRPVLFEGSVEYNLRMPFLLAAHGMRLFDKDWTIERLAAVGRTPDFLDRNSRDLSGGEAQLVALLRALQLAPLVLLLDEPTASLDPRAADAIELLVRDWQSAEKTRALVLVSHNAEQAGRVAQRTIRMALGQIENRG